MSSSDSRKKNFLFLVRSSSSSCLTTHNNHDFETISSALVPHQCFSTKNIGDNGLFMFPASLGNRAPHTQKSFIFRHTCVCSARKKAGAIQYPYLYSCVGENGFKFANILVCQKQTKFSHTAHKISAAAKRVWESEVRVPRRQCILRNFTTAANV